MTPPVLVSVINLSSRVTDAEVQQIASAVGKQLAQHASTFYGMVPAIEAIPKGGTPSPNGVPCWIDDVPDVDGALGYHDEDQFGQQFIKVFASPVLDNGGAVLTGSLAVSAVVSHEVLELLGDPSANLWADGPDGSDVARELADPVQGDSYDIDGVSVSNFVTPAWFDPHAEQGSRLDYMGKLSQPFTMSPGGYTIVRTEPGQVSNVFGAAHKVKDGLHLHVAEGFPEWQLAGKIRKALKRRNRHAR